MARVAFEVHTKLSPEQVMSMLIDFSPRRPERWPTLARELYCVHKIATTSADVQEGSRWPTLMWERDHYDWSMAGRVRWTVQASNYSKPGSYAEQGRGFVVGQVKVVHPPDMGSLTRSREFGQETHLTKLC